MRFPFSSLLSSHLKKEQLFAWPPIIIIGGHAAVNLFLFRRCRGEATFDHTHTTTPFKSVYVRILYHTRTYNYISLKKCQLLCLKRSVVFPLVVRILLLLVVLVETLLPLGPRDLSSKEETLYGKPLKLFIFQCHYGLYACLSPICFEVLTEVYVTLCGHSFW